MGAAEILLSALVLAFVAPVAWVVAQAARALYYERHPNEFAPCAPHRYASLTASEPQSRPTAPSVPQPRRQLATWAADYAVPTPDAVDAIIAGSFTYDLASLTAPAVPELPPVVEEQQGIAVDWPTEVVVPVPLSKQQTYR